MLKPIVAIAAGALLFIALGFLGAYVAGLGGALAGMIFGIVTFFLVAARIVGR